MVVQNEPLYDRTQTSERIKSLCNRFFSDLNLFAVKRNNEYIKLPDLSILDFFDIVKCVPYLRDTAPIEITSRPLWILLNCFSGADCKKKAIINGCYAKANGIQYRFIGSSNRPDKRLHHIYPEVFLYNKWLPFDATYNYFKFGEKKRNTCEIVL
jgi:hypothetical protein